MGNGLEDDFKQLLHVGPATRKLDSKRPKQAPNKRSSVRAPEEKGAQEFAGVGSRIDQCFRKRPR